MIPFMIVFVVWALVHSLTASLRFQAKMQQLMGQRAYDGLYRLLYNLFSVLTFLPVIVLAASALPDDVVWALPSPYSWIFILIQVAGLAGLAVSLIQTGALHFAGLSQALDYLTGRAEIDDEPSLVTSGMYAYVRHPLYFFSLVILWFAPVVTWQTLAFDLAATAYFWIGSVHEERKLVRMYGEAYENYRQRVPRLLPIKLRLEHN
jgi:protein-S-isoprenylcysteine O-methyltransferase Ste14